MRSYPTDSHDAVCRLLALAMIVDGHLAPSELQAMRHTAILDRIGADADRFDAAVHALCEDMLADARRRDDSEAELDKRQLDRLLDEVADPLLRMLVLQAMLDIVHADRRLDGREHLLLDRALKRWSRPSTLRDGIPRS